MAERNIVEQAAHYIAQKHFKAKDAKPSQELKLLADALGVSLRRVQMLRREGKFSKPLAASLVLLAGNRFKLSDLLTNLKEKK